MMTKIKELLLLYGHSVVLDLINTTQLAPYVIIYRSSILWQAALLLVVAQLVLRRSEWELIDIIVVNY